MKRGILSIIIISLLISITCGCKSKERLKFVSIGTGGVTGIYYPTGGAISRMVNKKKDLYKIKATVESTEGSVYNVNAILNGDLDFGIVQSDRQYQAYNGLAEWKDVGPQRDIRSVFSIYPEAITLIATEASGINSIHDLVDMRVNLGNPGSGHLQNAKDVLDAFSVIEDSFKAEYVKAVEAPGLMQDQRLDAFFYTVGHPNGNIKEATAGRISVKFIDISGPQIDAMLEKYPYYAKSYIPISLYPMAKNTVNINTIGVKATLVTSSKVSNEMVYAITKEVFDNFQYFKKLHPVYQTLTKKDMLSGLSAPIHPGALQYYKEAGLDKFIDKK